MQAKPTAGGDPDADLLQRLQAGDRVAFATLVDRHLPALQRFALRLLGNLAEAEDVSQETFLRAWERAGQWREGGARYATWLHQIALNLCRDRLRARRPEAAVDSEALPDPAPRPEQNLAEDQRGQALREAIAALPERQREALLLFHYQELNQQQAAAALEVSEDALESLLARARRSLRRRLDPSEPQSTAEERRA
jgi:RNA polymerase sigma-70 factor, ECF subfamily